MIRISSDACDANNANNAHHLRLQDPSDELGELGHAGVEIADLPLERGARPLGGAGLDDALDDGMSTLGPIGVLLHQVGFDFGRSGAITAPIRPCGAEGFLLKPRPTKRIESDAHNANVSAASADANGMPMTALTPVTAHRHAYRRLPCNSSAHLGACPRR